MKLNLSIASKDRALALWKTSPHASAFTHPHVLGLLAVDVHWWLCSNPEEPVCLWPVCVDHDGTVQLPGATYYVGPLWMPAESRIPVHRKLSTHSAVYEIFIKHFIERYGCVRASLPLGLDDIRVFDWWNYGEADKPRFSIAPRYTARIEGLQSKTMIDVMAGFRQVRRYEIKRIEKSPLLSRCTDWIASELWQLYQEIFHAKGDEPGRNARQSMQRMLDAVHAGFGELLAYRSEQGGLTYAGLMLYGKDTANLVYSMVSRDYRNSGLAAWAIRNQIMTAKSRGLDVFDFNGANSPSRGDDKHSYGAKAALFFEIALSKGE